MILTNKYFSWRHLQFATLNFAKQKQTQSSIVLILFDHAKKNFKLFAKNIFLLKCTTINDKLLQMLKIFPFK